MIDLLFVALFQAVSGEPAEPAPSAAPPAATETQATAPATEEEADDEGLVCRRERVTGSRARFARICTTAEQRRQAQSTLRHIQNHSGSTQPGGTMIDIGN